MDFRGLRWFSGIYVIRNWIRFVGVVHSRPLGVLRDWCSEWGFCLMSKVFDFLFLGAYLLEWDCGFSGELRMGGANALWI